MIEQDVLEQFNWWYIWRDAMIKQHFPRSIEIDLLVLKSVWYSQLVSVIRDKHTFYILYVRFDRNLRLLFDWGQNILIKESSNIKWPFVNFHLTALLCFLLSSLTNSFLNSAWVPTWNSRGRAIRWSDWPYKLPKIPATKDTRICCV